MKILLVDDDYIIREGMKKLITKANASWNIVAEAMDGESGLEKFLEHSDIDLIITDVTMPIMNGIEFIQQVRKINDKVKILVLSGYSDFSYVRNAFMNGVLDYLLKPFSKQELLAYIEKAEKSILEIKKSELNNKETKRVLIADILARLFNHKSGQELLQNIGQLETFGVRIDFPYYMVMIVRADQYDKQFWDISQYEKQLSEDVVCILAELKKREDISWCHSVNAQELALLIFCHSQAVCEEIAKQIYQAVSSNEDELHTCTMAMGNLHSNRTEIPAAYKEAKEAAAARFYLGQNQIIRYSEITGKCIDMQYDLEPLARQLVHYLELCEAMSIRKTVEQLFLDLSYSRPDKFRKYIHMLMEMLIVRIEDFENILLLYGRDYQFQIDFLNTYRELKTYINSIMQGAVEYIKGEKEKKSKKRIELAKNYIEEHYHEQITLNDVADYVELNASYFSHLFREEMGLKFSEYLLGVRMEKAKKLLRDPKIKVYEIGNLVGYEDAVSFGRAFKKKLGMSPKEYRNTVY